MDETALRARVRHFLKKEAKARSGGDLNYNEGLLIGGKRVGRPRKVGRPKVVKHRAPKGGARGNSEALSDWRKYLDAYRRKHPNLPYREAQKRASIAYKK